MEKKMLVSSIFSCFHTIQKACFQNAPPKVFKSHRRLVKLKFFTNWQTFRLVHIESNCRVHIEFGWKRNEIRLGMVENIVGKGENADY